jgi:hypothetical protein
MIRYSVETGESWWVASVSLLVMACSFGAPWIAIVALKTIAADLDGARSTPALAGSLAWLGVASAVSSWAGSPIESACVGPSCLAPS